MKSLLFSFGILCFTTVMASAEVEDSHDPGPIVVIHGMIQSMDENVVVMKLKSGKIQKYDRKLVLSPIKTTKIEILATDFEKAQIK